jgi:hypothetical protein
MPGSHDNRPNESRLDRMERLMAESAEHHVWFDGEYGRLVAAQAVLTERLARLTERLDRMRPPEDPA